MLCSFVLFPVTVTFFVTWWLIQFIDGFFSPLYARMGVNIFGKPGRILQPVQAIYGCAIKSKIISM